MLEQIHEHITSELNQGARTDTIFVVTAIVFNLLVLGINSVIAGIAGSPDGEPAFDIVLGILIALLLLVNSLAIAGLLTGRQTRSRLIEGLLSMYRDHEVDKYYDAALLTNYARRYLIFTGVILCLAVTAIAVPLIIRFV
jgi:hypothetical protein